MPTLFEPFTMRGLTLRNRITVSPMCQYSAHMGLANDWHLVNLGRFVMGGFGLVIVEATAVEQRGRITYGCLGLWSDAHIEPLKRIVDFAHQNNTPIGIQIGHAGRKASDAVPYRPKVDEKDRARLSYENWEPVAPSPLPHEAGWQTPHELSIDEIAEITQAFVDSTLRAETAGFDVLELHFAHGYLVDQFLSPLANKRDDKYGGSLENRMRLALEITEAVRAVWPVEKPLFARISTQDWNETGWQIADSVVLANELKARGVDLMDCSSGGFAEARITTGPAYQLPFSEAVREGAEMPTMAVGLMGDPIMANEAIVAEKADLVALARAALDDPNWPVRAMEALGLGARIAELLPPQSAGAVVSMKRMMQKRG